MTNAEHFLQLFNQLERHLRELDGSTEFLGFRRLVNRLSRTNGIVNTHKQDLIEYSELRNAIVHKSEGEVIAEPHAEIVAELEQIHALLTNPPQVMDIAAHPVFTCATTDQLLPIVKTMKNKLYTYVPVMHDGRFVGVFSEGTLIKWLADQSENQSVDLPTITIGQLQQYFDQADDKHNAFTFVSKDTDAYQVREAFFSFVSEEKRLGAIFVTEHGQAQEKIEGIVTAWDLPKIGRVTQEKLPHATR